MQQTPSSFIHILIYSLVIICAFSILGAALGSFIGMPLAWKAENVETREHGWVSIGIMAWYFLLYALCYACFVGLIGMGLGTVIAFLMTLKAFKQKKERFYALLTFLINSLVWINVSAFAYQLSRFPLIQRFF